MQIAGRPARAGSESRSASDTTSTVSMPSCRQVRITRSAISPRLAIRTRRIRMQLRPRRAAAPRRYSTSSPLPRRCAAPRRADAGAHRVHQLHHLDDADDRVRLDLRAHLDKGRLARLGRAIEDAQQGRGNRDSSGRRRQHGLPLAWVSPAPGRPLACGSADGAAPCASVRGLAARAAAPSRRSSPAPARRSCDSSSSRRISATSFAVRLTVCLQTCS